MERCCGQAAMVHADHVNSWWGVELLIPLLKYTKYYYFCELKKTQLTNIPTMMEPFAPPVAWFCCPSVPHPRAPLRKGLGKVAFKWFRIKLYI